MERLHTTLVTLIGNAEDGNKFIRSVVKVMPYLDQENAIVIKKRDDRKTMEQGAKGGHQALQELIALVNETMVSFQRYFRALAQRTLTHRKDGSVTKELRERQEREPDNFDKLYDDGDERRRIARRVSRKRNRFSRRTKRNWWMR